MKSLEDANDPLLAGSGVPKGWAENLSIDWDEGAFGAARRILEAGNRRLDERHLGTRFGG